MGLVSFEGVGLRVFAVVGVFVFVWVLCNCRWRFRFGCKCGVRLGKFAVKMYLKHIRLALFLNLIKVSFLSVRGTFVGMKVLLARDNVKFKNFRDYFSENVHLRISKIFE